MLQSTVLLSLVVVSCLAKQWFITLDKEIDEIETLDYVARVQYNNSINQTGWAFLKATTNQKYNDTTQFYYAGYLEGYLTQDLIHNAFKNFVEGVMRDESTLTEKGLQFLEEQLRWMRDQCQQSQDTLWRQVCNLLQQLDGMYWGYTQRVLELGDSSKILSFRQFYYLTNMGDLEDVIPAFAGQIEKYPNCNALIKLSREKGLMVGHNTFNVYSLMLRVYKTYEFALHDQAVINNITFSSRPGDLESKDDFITLSSGMVVVETSLNNWNPENYKFLQPYSLPTWVRVNIASRLASTTQEWAEYFEKHRSGTHNNQWLVIDLKPKELLKPKNILMVEESFYLFKVHDVTYDLLAKFEYVASFNVAYDEEIWKRAKYDVGYPKTYLSDPRAIQFREMSTTIQNVMDLGKVVRSNLNSTFDICGDAISPRCDLLPNNSYAFGGIDGKVIDLEMFLQNKVLLISSPSYQNLEPFSWEKFENVPHYGMADQWRFPWIQFNWKTFEIEIIGYDE